MTQINLTLPDSFSLDEKETKRFLAAKMYESDKLSLGQAATLAGLSKATFAEILADYNVAFINYQPSEISQDASRF